MIAYQFCGIAVLAAFQLGIWLGRYQSQRKTMLDTARIYCKIDWIDGACRKSDKAGTLGWEQRQSLNGESFWVCPDHSQEYFRTEQIGKGNE